MRLTPAQVGMMELLGHRLPTWSEEAALPGRIRAGHAFLVRITGRDFGLDPARWHDCLWETDAGEYRLGFRRRELARAIRRAANDPEWVAAIAALRGAAEPGAADARSEHNL
jgi:hypothetical protein